MSRDLLEALASVAESSLLRITEVDRLLSCDWAALYLRLPKKAASDLEVERQFLIGLKDEFVDGYWDGGHDQVMLDRLIAQLRTARRAGFNPPP
jgi:hypothetical protein